MSRFTDIYGSMVFSDIVMRERLPKETYRALRKTINEGKHLDFEIAAVVANAMKDWAVEKGATHFTHWFQPMTGITAEKHDSFLSPAADGKAIIEFSGKELTRGEPDASSFPSGGIRATFEARGYTAWDPTSYAFVKDRVLYIPTAFCSYGGEALDKKTPLLRSMAALDVQAKRVLRLFGNTAVASVRPTVGAEQEYFLIDRAMYERRPDLIYTNRTLFGAKPPKGQELDDHYFGMIRTRVMAFMRDVDEELWKLGIPAKTEHNEAAPAQHELAPVFTTANIAADNNQLVMEVLRKTAERHNMKCILHEKPFAGVNGSGKHVNWSLSTDTGLNLFEPGDTPYENAQFLLFLCAVLKAVDDYQELLRICVASAGNDHRLGANEAPPAVISVFLGEELAGILDAVENELDYDAPAQEMLKIGVDVLPWFPKDATDRNRTSPFAFTGNTFEFRMPGSSASISEAVIAINTAVAQVLEVFAGRLEGAKDFNAALHSLICHEIRAHKRIIFNGNGYDEAWIAEAARRGLSNLATTPDCLDAMLSRKNIELYARHHVLNETEFHARYEIMAENYVKVLRIEALTMLEMAKRQFLPSVSAYTRELAETVKLRREALPEDACAYECAQLARLSALLSDAHSAVRALEGALDARHEKKRCAAEMARYFEKHLLPPMDALRAAVDAMETVTPGKSWPYPNYGELLFSVK